MNYLMSRWDALPVVDATPIPEIRAEEFSRELLLSLTHNLATPVVIRDAIKVYCMRCTRQHNWSHLFGYLG